ncbi:hypothetical protein ACFQPA_17535 [Halomarina halobia]|uniref:MarR family transcriptional regulator n=1 Tax=Halomarina halobia TaxID=3033386 RepID=A0ABD6AED2_9EURY|nr:hypothetical protein [Halomarina sp. PSR21]
MDFNSPRHTPLGPLASDALEHLEPSMWEAEGTNRETAREVLEDQGFTESEADAALTQLLSRGYLYEVNGDLYLTPTGDDRERS